MNLVGVWIEESCVVGLFALIALLGCVSSSGSGPKISVSPKSWDFGTIPQEKAAKTFTLQNAGDAVLEIKRVSTSCGCTTASVEKDELMPGESTGLVVQFDPNSMEPPDAGEILRVVYIKSNDPNMPELEIEIRANVAGGV